MIKYTFIKYTFTPEIARLPLVWRIKLKRAEKGNEPTYGRPGILSIHSVPGCRVVTRTGTGATCPGSLHLDRWALYYMYISWLLFTINLDFIGNRNIPVSLTRPEWVWVSSFIPSSINILNPISMAHVFSKNFSQFRCEIFKQIILTIIVRAIPENDGRKKSPVF